MLLMRSSQLSLTSNRGIIANLAQALKSVVMLPLLGQCHLTYNLLRSLAAVAESEQKQTEVCLQQNKAF